MKPTGLPRARASMARALDAILPRLDESTAVTGGAHARAIRGASLWWVSAEMTALALDASRTLPEWSPVGAAPDDVGLLWWDGALPPAPYDGARRSMWPVGALGIPTPPEAPVRGVLWWTVGGRVELYALICPGDLPAEMWQIPVGELIQSTGVLLAPTVHDQPLHDPDGELVVGVDRSWMQGLIALTGATWLLMMEPRISERQNVGVRRPTGGGRRRGSVSVATIALRRTVRPPTPEAGDTPRWRLTRRHVVRGHWRLTPVGQGRERREPRWVHTHIKGPDGTPLTSPEHVHTWRR